jgi:phosphoglucomutase
VYKIYAESFRSEDHLRQIQHEAQNAVASLPGFQGEARTVKAI